MALVKDKPKAVRWFGAHHSWGPQVGFSKMVQMEDPCWGPVGGSAMRPS